MSGQHVADADDAAVGVAETTVARLLSKIYASLGFLSKGHLVETDRSGIVAGFVGQTALKTREVCQQALGQSHRHAA